MQNYSAVLELSIGSGNPIVSIVPVPRIVPVYFGLAYRHCWGPPATAYDACYDSGVNSTILRKRVALTGVLTSSGKVVLR